MAHWLDELLDKGRAAERAERAEGEDAKLGTMRGGNTGALIKGKFYGKCARLSWLRSVGLELPIEPETYEMFDAGYGNEDIVARLLEASGVGILQEEQCPIEWELPNGTKVQGRPDIVIPTEESDAAYSHGIELKLVSSIWTAKSVHYDLRPKSDHLLQAGHYAYQLGVPYTLTYISRCYWHLSTAPGWLRDKFRGDVYNVKYREDGEPLRIEPFRRHYDLEWRDDVLWYTTEGIEWRQTRLTWDAIVKYYTVASELGEAAELPAPPCGVSIDGSKSFKACDYCDLADVCKEHKEASAWRDHARDFINALNAEETQDE